MVDGRRAADVDLTDVAVTSAALLGGYAKRLIVYGSCSAQPRASAPLRRHDRNPQVAATGLLMTPADENPFPCT